MQKQLFVYDLGDGPQTLVNPTIMESRGEWVYDEGCLSIPQLYVEIVRPKEVLLPGGTSTATRWRSRPTSCRPGCSSTSWTTCRAC